MPSSTKPTLPAVSPELSPPSSGSAATPSQGVSSSIWSSTPVSSFGSGQEYLPSYGESSYESPTYVASTGKKCNLLNKLCPLKKHHQPLPSAQVLPTSQSQTCDTVATMKVKKPCFLKTFLHHKTCSGKGCGCSGDGCDAHVTSASPQDSFATPQY
jgi:hypothetical protein